MSRAATFAISLLLATAPLTAQQLPTATPEDVGFSSERLERIGELFESYVDDGRIAGAIGMVLRHGKVAYFDEWGMRDMAAHDAMASDDIFRIYSMSKPITSVAVMMLYEEGRFFLTDPVGRYIPEFANLPVAKLAEATSMEDIPTERARRPVTIQDLLRHTSGLSYGIFSNTPVDSLYNRSFVLFRPNLAEMMTALGKIPLMYQPGTEWNYSVSTDVLGRLVEVVSGQPFDEFLEQRILGPLGMVDTGFHVPEKDLNRLTRTYAHTGADRTLVLGDTVTFSRPTTLFSGGGGLVSTTHDYARFAQMLLNGGELDGARLLSRKTVDLMTTDHLGDAGTGWLSPGWGFGLGFTVKNVPGLDGMPGSVGDFNWAGLHGTSFWVDPQEDLVGVFMVQIYPNTDIDFRGRFKAMVYQALIG